MVRRRRDNPDLLTVGETMGGLRSDYDAARNTRFKRKRVGVASMGSGADYHYRNPTAFYKTIELARDVYRNNSVVGQGIRRLIANVVQGGFVYDPDTGNPELNAALNARWTEWSEDADICDIAGEETFHGLTCLAMKAMIVDGDIFGLLTEQGSIKTVEAHRVKTPSRTKRNVVLGILLDEFRRRQEVWITRDEIEAEKTVSRVGDITAYPFRDSDGERQVLQLYWPDRVTQTRGVTAFQQAIATADHGDDLQFAQLLKAQLAACYVIIRQLKEGATPQTPGQHGEREEEQRPDGSIRTIEGVGPAMEVYGYPGETITGFTPNIPNAEYFKHTMQILTTIAINLDLPVQVLLLDPSMTNFSGWRGAMEQAKFRFRQFQERLIVRWHRPIMRWKIRQWLADDAGLRLMAAGGGVDVFRHGWNPPTWPYIQPREEAQADLLRVRNCQTSPRRFASERGMDWPKLVGEIVEDTSLLIESAYIRAEELNTTYPDLGITWREIASLPTPDGVTIQVSDEEPLGTKAGDDKQEDKNDGA